VPPASLTSLNPKTAINNRLIIMATLFIKSLPPSSTSRRPLPKGGFIPLFGPPQAEGARGDFLISVNSILRLLIMAVMFTTEVLVLSC
jgi:hypothetical protein